MTCKCPTEISPRGAELMWTPAASKVSFGDLSRLLAAVCEGSLSSSADSLGVGAVGLFLDSLGADRLGMGCYPAIREKFREIVRVEFEERRISLSCRRQLF